MCKYYNSNPLFGLNFENILQLFSNTDVPIIENGHKKKKTKKKKKGKRHKKRKAAKQKKKLRKQPIVVMDDLDMDDWPDLPRSEDGFEVHKDLNAQNNLIRIRHGSAFDISRLKDSSDSEEVQLQNDRDVAFKNFIE